MAEVQASAAACKRYALANGVGALRFNTVILKVDVYHGMTCPVKACYFAHAAALPHQCSFECTAQPGMKEQTPNATRKSRFLLELTESDETVEMKQEPPKAALLSFEKGTGPRPERIAECVLVIPSTSAAAEALVRLSPTTSAAPEDVSAEVVSWTLVCDAHSDMPLGIAGAFISS